MAEAGRRARTSAKPGRSIKVLQSHARTRTPACSGKPSQGGDSIPAGAFRRGARMLRAGAAGRIERLNRGVGRIFHLPASWAFAYNHAHVSNGNPGGRASDA